MIMVYTKTDSTLHNTDIFQVTNLFCRFNFRQKDKSLKTTFFTLHHTHAWRKCGISGNLK